MPVLTVHLTEADHESLRDLAWVNRCSMSEFLRRLIAAAQLEAIRTDRTERIPLEAKVAVDRVPGPADHDYQLPSGVMPNLGVVRSITILEDGALETGLVPPDNPALAPGVEAILAQPADPDEDAHNTLRSLANHQGRPVLTPAELEARVALEERTVANADRLGIPLDAPALLAPPKLATGPLAESWGSTTPADRPVVDPPAPEKSRTPAADAAMPAAAAQRRGRQAAKPVEKPASSAKEHVHKQISKGPLTGCRDCDMIRAQDGVWRLPA